MNDIDRVNNYTDFLNKFYKEDDLPYFSKGVILSAIKALKGEGDPLSTERLEEIDRDIVDYTKAKKESGATTEKIAEYIKNDSPLKLAKLHLDPQFSTDYLRMGLEGGDEIVFTKELLESADFSAFTEEEKLDIGRKCAHADIKLFCDYIDKLVPDERTNRLNLALDLVDTKEHLFQYLHHFKITDHDDIIKIIEKGAQYFYGKPKNIRDDMFADLYQFTKNNKIDFLEIAEKIFQFNSLFISDVVSKIPKENHDLLVESLKIATRHVSKYSGLPEEVLENEALSSEEQFEILTELANHNPEALIYSIENNNSEVEFVEVFDQEMKRILLEKCLSKAEAMKPESFELFGVEIESSYDLLEEISKTNGRVLLELLPRLNLTPEQKLKFAQNILENSPETVAKLMPFFNFEEESIRFEFAEKCAKFPFFASLVDLFQLTHEHAKQIWTVSYQSNPSESSKYLNKFGIDDPDFLYQEIYKIAQDGWRVGESINLIPIEWQKQRMQVALEYGKQRPYSLAYSIESFGLESEEDRFKLALICANQAPADFGSLIRDFKISDRSRLMQVLKCYVAKWAKEFDEEFVKSSAQGFYGLSLSEDELKELCIVALRENPLAATWFMYQKMEKEIDELLREISEFVSIKNYNDRNLNRSKEFLKMLKESGCPVFEVEKLLAKVESATNLVEAQLAYNLFYQKLKLAHQMDVVARVVLNKEEFKGFLDSGIYNQILAYGQPGSAWTLFGIVLEQFKTDQNPELQKIDQWISEKKSAATGKEFIAILCKSLVVKGVEPATVQSLLQFIFNTTQNFKDGKKATDLIDFLVELVSRDDWDHEIKERIMGKMCVDVNANMRTAYDNSIKGKKLSPKQIEQGFEAYKLKNKSEPYLHEIVKNTLSLLRFEKEELLKRYLDGASYASILETEFENSVLNHPIDHFFEKFSNTFGKFRNQAAIFQYASSIAKLKDDKASASLSEFAEAVIEGRFLEHRYDVEGSIHLKTIHESYPKVLEKWKSNSKPIPFAEAAGELDKGSKNGNYVVVETDAPDDILLCGTEVYGSCQHVLKNPDKNKGLLGYLMNGTNKIIKVSNGENGVIEARCMIRLLWDGHRPVLFKEYVYPSPGSLEINRALDLMAKQKARELGVPLIEKPLEDRRAGEVYNQPIYSLGGRGPYEYSDATRQVSDYGKYTIDSAFIMYDPAKEPNDFRKEV